MAVSADKIVVQLEADVNDYTTKISNAQRVSDQKFDAIERKGFEMGQSLKKSFSLASAATTAFLGSLAVEKVVEAVKVGLEYAASLKSTAEQVGVTTDALQEYHYAATQVGVSQQQMDTALANLTKTMGQAANGSKQQYAAFAQLSKLIGTDILRSARDAGEAIPMIAEALAKIEDPAEQARLKTQLFGEAGQKLGTLLAGGSDAVNNLREAAHRLGEVLSERQIEQADVTAAKLADLKTVMSANIAGVVADNANAILGLANALAKLVSWIGTAITAYEKLKLLQGEAGSLFQKYTSLDPNMRQQGADQATRFRVARNRLDPNNIDQRGGFRDYSLAPVPGYKPGVPGGQRNVIEPPVKPTRTKSAGGGRSAGPSQESVDREHAKRLDRLREDQLRAQLDLTDDTEERASIQGELLDAEYQSRLDEMKNDARFQKLKKSQQDEEIKALQVLYGKGTQPGQDELTVNANKGLLAQRIARDTAERDERAAQALADAQHDAQTDALQVQLSLADTESERRRISLLILDAEQAYLKAKLDAVINSEVANADEKERARIARSSLDATAPGKREQVLRNTQGPLDKYLADTDPAKNAERAEQLVADELDHVQQGITSALTKAIGTDDPLITGLINMLLQEVLFRPLAEALKGGMGGLGGGGGILGGLVGGIGHVFGFASGGSMTIGGRGGNDNNTLSLNGRPIANVQRGETLSVGSKALNGRGGGTTVISQTFTLDARGGITTPQLLQYVNQTAQTAGQAAYNGAMRDTPVTMAKRQRYG